MHTDFRQARNSLTQRTFGPECSGTLALDVNHMKDGDFAGLAALQKKHGLVGVRRSGDASSIVRVSAQSDSPAETQAVSRSENMVFLKVEGDFRNRADEARFYYRLHGNQWTAIGKPLRMAYTLAHFMSCRFALFNYTTKVRAASWILTTFGWAAR